MRQPGKNNRQRGRGRRSGGGQINRNTTIDSNGPDVRLRGNALQLHEKYTSLGNDASANGERIQAEAYYQYADHYFRVQSSIVAAQEERREKSGDHQGGNQQSGKDTKNDHADKDLAASASSADEDKASDNDEAETADEAVAIEPVTNGAAKEAAETVEEDATA